MHKILSLVMSTVLVTAATAATPTNPLLDPWAGPYGGVPPFDKASPALLAPALEAGMTAHLAELDRIANDPAPATFANTIAAMERSGRALDRASTVYYIFGSTLSDDAVQQVERDIEPKMAAFRDSITQNEKLFRRIAAVYETREKSGLTAEEQRLTWLTYTNFVRAGAKLDVAAKKRLAEINQSLAGLFTQFSQNLLADESERYTVLESEAELAGLPESLRAGFAADAERRGQKGKWIIANTRSSVEPFLTYSTRRDLREKVWRVFVNRGDNGDARDNNAIIGQILQLRAERARLLGFATHAHWRLENSMARTPERAMQLMEAVWKPAVARVAEEVADMQKIADADGGGIRIEPWDYRYYAEKVRKAKYDLDTNELKPYLQLEKLREGMFFVAGELFGLRFTEVAAGSVPVYHPDVRVWRVDDKAGNLVGLWYFDPYARVGKQSGAWMNAYRNQERFDGEVKTIVSNNSNFVKGKPGEPVLISWDDAVTLFHEFGHALHGLASNVNYPSVSGTNVARDYVEFPSQLLEHWLPIKEVLDRFAVHYQTGKPIPAELLAKVEKAKTFNQGFATVEYLAAALVDMKLHLAAKPDSRIDPDAFERETLQALGMPREIVMRHRTPQFGHIFSGDGYSAGYYSYLWADTLTADAWEAFTEGKGAWDRGVATRLRNNVFSVGNTIDPADAYRAFRGRDPQIEALMRKRGFMPAAHKGDHQKVGNQ
ncbi:MAG: M3 family peptidase [Gammaproteobacteria bacterium]|jgi:peptidyl-dipeptidase Dcp|nr:M3 family peptidase [Gammaproteobacteria bacterium]NCW20185.1 M3 family peptidase [Gammaproteobacteria bacterium]NCW56319.1 M3 family peptidase [Gammaproteobacteria bacterium]NDB15290.1 M3 family peptidase [Gammaproteobacteria bacterium]NDB25208.1 M3 family peptidase [Gammaproteobacteria bacterium]